MTTTRVSDFKGSVLIGEGVRPAREPRCPRCPPPARRMSERGVGRWGGERMEAQGVPGSPGDRRPRRPTDRHGPDGRPRPRATSRDRRPLLLGARCRLRRAVLLPAAGWSPRDRAPRRRGGRSRRDHDPLAPARRAAVPSLRLRGRRRDGADAPAPGDRERRHAQARARPPTSTGTTSAAWSRSCAASTSRWAGCDGGALGQRRPTPGPW